MSECHRAPDTVRGCIAELAASTGRTQEVQLWSRSGLKASSLKTTSRGGPDWSLVAGGVTVGANDWRLLECRFKQDIGRANEHARLAGGVQDTITYLLYFLERPKQLAGRRATRRPLHDAL